MVLLRDNARSHVFRVTHVKRAKFKWEELDYPPYSPNMSPKDFHVFSLLKKYLKGQRFNSVYELNDAVKTRSRYDHRYSGSAESIGSLINGIVVLRPLCIL